MAGGSSGSAQVKQSRIQRGITGKIKSRNAVTDGLMLTSMLDILTCILFFLLKNYSTIVTDFTAAKDITLPFSSSLQPAEAALHLVVTKESILLDDEPVAKILNGDVEKSDLFQDGVTITKLAQLLKSKKDKILAQSPTINPKEGDKPFTGAIVLQADKTVPFSLLKKVIYTAGISDFVLLKLAVMKKDS